MNEKSNYFVVVLAAVIDNFKGFIFVVDMS